MIPPFNLAKFGLSHFFEFRCYSGHGVTNDGCSIGVYRGLCWDLTADRLLLSEHGLPGLLMNGLPEWPMMGFSSSESKRLDCTGWRGVLVKWTCFSSCLRGGIGGASSFLLHKIVSSCEMLTAPPLRVLTVPGIQIRMQLIWGPEIFSPGSSTFGIWLNAWLFF